MSAPPNPITPPLPVLPQHPEPHVSPRTSANPDWYTQGVPHIWLPYSQMKTAPAPLAAQSTQNARITLTDGRELVDGVAAWWTACHGYNHPHIRAAVAAQLATMPHVMFGGMVHEPALRLASRLCAMLPGDLDRVFFTDSGSVAVEVAMKMAIQYRLNTGEPKRTKMLAFKGGYHGDTLATMAVCDPEEGMHHLYGDVLANHIIAPLPQDEASEAAFFQLLDDHAHELTAILTEPLVQGAGGMLFHTPAVLRTLREAADRYGLLLILDEIFTGFGRTGTMFACEQAGIVPDIITLSKALTGGTMALAATIARPHVYDAFLSDNPEHALMHGPTFMANALACASANASLDLFETEPRLEQVAAIEAHLKKNLERCRTLPGVKDVRVLGAIGVVELEKIDNPDALRQRFIAENVWIRPFRSIVYLTPAFTIPEDDLTALTDAIYRVLSTDK
ncbi:adenosylmethionine-8-amino-7-oxononanoate aminotransferase [Acetobacter orleanensis NRIC 0473]|uniref:Adenosylmethionine-8-amino-7-oxononanoate aminotransferase n=2 Tax=Acetobacter orleanensis TaxID=104099 RepID=A0A4Y3TLA1_9PROT|nr:adenosylmethionine--8-amino-7-oxononanoate transaminase [Acetobacter orleanensis]GAN68862.1 aminotransferase, adenosylmethionine--8-amino-7-oxononanoate aminotransferase [Acetobacter orleanensis JCM 7639]GBR30924.1 adenosylmethionine-8-amino-7-oxononanoate aminotransferase [Acetobacter orleanensis NRIC 0473]GEB81730.1 adenosylmethionine--8-amino-7-oxononanoate aminotransferase BioA [Acetobacter orleanensis]